MEPSSRRDDEPLPQRVASACGGLTVAGKATEEATMKKPQAKRMGWSNESRISSRVIVANFLRSMGRQKPWWFRVVYTTDGVDKSELSHLFGYDDAVTLHILDAAGLVQHNTLFKRIVFVEFAWQSLFSEFKLTNRINRKQIAGTRCWWLKVGGGDDKSGHSHEVQDQYKKNKPKVGASAKTPVLMKQPRYRVYGLQKTFATDINGIMTSDMTMMIYDLLASTSSTEVGTATTGGHDSDDEDYDYNITVDDDDEMTPPDDGDDASQMMLPILGALPMATEELDMAAYPILSRLFPSESGGLPAWQLSGLLQDIVNLYKKSKTLDETAMSFPYGNGKNCNLVVVPETNSYANFSKVNREKQWIAQIMKHMSSEKK